MNTLQRKWKTLLKTARDREVLKKEPSKSGGGSLTPKQKKIVRNSLYEDLAGKLGISAKGNAARFDDDSNENSPIIHPTHRLRKRLHMEAVTGDPLDITPLEPSELQTESLLESGDDASTSTTSTITKLSSSFRGKLKIHYSKTICHA